MELDDMKAAWATIARRLEQQHQLAIELKAERRLEGARRSLRPLFWGQLLQIAFGVLVVWFAMSVWPQHRAEPWILAQGLVVQLYGVLAIIGGGLMLAALDRVDYSAPVVQIQARLAKLRRLHVIAGMVLGWSWWLLWIPIFGLLFALIGVNVWKHAPAAFLGSVAVGVVGLVGMSWFYVWARDPRRPRAAKLVDDSTVGRSLRKAQAVVDEVGRFTAE